MTSLSSIKDTSFNLPENCFINKLSSYSQANCTGAFSTRLLKANYTGPMVNVRQGFVHPTAFLTSNTSNPNYIASQSSTGFGEDAWRMFDNTNLNARSVNGVYSGGNYIGSVTTLINGSSVAGEWIQLEIVNGISNITTVSYTAAGLTNNYANINVCVSNDNVNFTSILTTSVSPFGVSTFNTSIISGIYRYVRTVVTNNHGASFCGDQEWSITNHLYSDFYGNINGSLGTSIYGRGQSLSSWLNGNTGFIEIWYNQMGITSSNLIQITKTAQPIINSTGTAITYNGSKSLYNTTNIPLTNSLKTYTFICNFNPSSFGGTNSIISIGPTSYSNNTRATMMYYGENYGFTGGANDVFPITVVPNASSRKCIMMCNHNLTTGNVVITDNATVYTNTTNGSPSSLNLSAQMISIGAAITGGETFVGDINEIIIFSNTLTTRESQLYFVPNVITKKDYTSSPKIQLKGILKYNTPMPTDWRFGFDAQNFGNLTSGNTISAWSSRNNVSGDVYTQTTITPFNSIIYRVAGESPGGGNLYPLTQAPYIELTRASTHYLNGGSRTFNITSNTGFTAIIYCRFTGSLAAWERVFDFGNGQASENLFLSRSNTSSSFRFALYNGGTEYGITGGTITQNQWDIITVRYTRSSNYMEIIQNGLLVSTGTAGATITNKTLSNTYVGRSNWAADAYASINISGMYMYDRYITDTELGAINNHLLYSTTVNLPMTLPDYTKIFPTGITQNFGFRIDSAMHFNGGIYNYIDIQDVPSVPFTYCFWYYSTNVTVGNTVVALTDLSRNISGIQIDILSGTLTVYAALPSQWSTSSFSVSNGIWYHLTIVVNTSFQVLVYSNGSLYQTLTGTEIPRSRSRFTIGAAGDNARGYNGYINDFRVYDYALRASEISNIYDDRNELQLTYTSKANYIVNVYNWYSIMNVTKVGSFTPTFSVTDPNVQLQMSNNTNNLQTRIEGTSPVSFSNMESYVFSLEFFSLNAAADIFQFYCGDLLIEFQVYNPNTPGIYIKLFGSTVKYLNSTIWKGLSRWVPLTITYTRGSIETFVINLNGMDIYKHSLSTALTSNLFTFGCYSGTGGENMSLWIRRLELSYIPFVSSLNNSLNSSLKIYPTGAMTANTTVLSDGTYIASASSTGGGSPYFVFNNTFNATNTIWYPTSNTYNVNSGIYAGSTTTTVSGTSYSGEWIQIQIPIAIVIKSYALNIYWTSDNFKPRSFILAASNDGSSWFLLSTINNKTNWVYGTEEYFQVETINSYNYYRLIFLRNGISDNNPNCDVITVDSLKLFANQNTDKLPIAPLTSNVSIVPGDTLGNGGYIVRRSSLSSGYPEEAFNSFKGTIDGGSVWHSDPNVYNSSGIYTGAISTTVSGTSYNGEWIQIRVPNKIQLSSFNLLPRKDFGSTTRQPRLFVLAGSNDEGITWEALHISTSITDWTIAEKQFICNQSNRNTFNYFRLIVRELGNSSSDGFINIGNISLVPAKSLSSGNGLSVYPPAALTANSTTLSGYVYGNGLYVASMSSINNNSPYNMFDRIFNTTSNSSGVSGYNTSTGVYSGSTSTTLNTGAQLGEWYQIELPNSISLYSISLRFYWDSGNFVMRSFVLGASNDGSTWINIYSMSLKNDTFYSETHHFNINSITKYRYYRLIVVRAGSADSTGGNPNQGFVTLDGWELYDSSSKEIRGLIDGFTWKYYDGNHGDSVTYTQTNTYRNIGTTVNTTSLKTVTNSEIPDSSINGFTIELFGYFRANITGTWSFSLGSDDGSYLWINTNALSGYTTGNSNINNGGTHTFTTVSTTVTLVAGIYYPMRILYGDITGGALLQFSFTPPGGVATFNGNGYFFSSTGLNSAYPAESAKIIKDISNINIDGSYYINVNGISTETYCLMNDMYDGGGWMMLMKATTGTTFQYSSTHWTTTSVLNETLVNRNNSDAKYNVFNYNTVKDVMAIWPDINPDSYTNVYGKNGGSFYVKDGWVWKVDNWNGTSRTTGLAGFQSFRRAGNGPSGESVINPNDIANPFKYNGFSSGIFSSISNSYLHVFGSSGYSSNFRWGFIFNNEADFATADNFGGIGVSGDFNMSAGDRYSGGGGGTSGINRRARVEVYGR